LGHWTAIFMSKNDFKSNKNLGKKIVDPRKIWSKTQFTPQKIIYIMGPNELKIQDFDSIENLRPEK